MKRSYKKYVVGVVVDMFKNKLLYVYQKYVTLVYLHIFIWITNNQTN